MYMKTVAIYSTPTCHYCNMAKDFFKKNNIAYTEYNVATDLAKRKEMVEKSGQMGVPVIEIDGKLSVGFDEAEIKGALGVK
ncbi:MAG: hypothetical protein RLZZ347_306 [Candidatus Parcubacteria bacterium]|jgi:glutaredoxin-like YruB-family protein